MLGMKKPAKRTNSNPGTLLAQFSMSLLPVAAPLAGPEMAHRLHTRVAVSKTSLPTTPTAPAADSFLRDDTMVGRRPSTLRRRLSDTTLNTDGFIKFTEERERGLDTSPG